MQYQDYKNFSEEYREFLVKLVSDHDQCPSYDVFLRKCKIALDRRTPLKYKYLRSNHSLFMNKDISKAIMDRTIEGVEQLKIEKLTTNKEIIVS